VEEEILFLPLTFIAEIIGSMKSFGSSTILISLALILVDFKPPLCLLSYGD
jgi:hypothetical protein